MGFYKYFYNLKIMLLEHEQFGGIWLSKIIIADKNNKGNLNSIISQYYKKYFLNVKKLLMAIPLPPQKNAYDFDMIYDFYNKNYILPYLKTIVSTITTLINFNIP